MSGRKRVSPVTASVIGLIAVAWAVVIALLLDFYFEWRMLETFGRFLLSWL